MIGMPSKLKSKNTTLVFLFIPPSSSLLPFPLLTTLPLFPPSLPSAPFYSPSPASFISFPSPSSSSLSSSTLLSAFYTRILPSSSFSLTRYSPFTIWTSTSSFLSLFLPSLPFLSPTSLSNLFDSSKKLFSHSFAAPPSFSSFPFLLLYPSFLSPSVPFLPLPNVIRMFY